MTKSREYGAQAGTPSQTTRPSCLSILNSACHGSLDKRLRSTSTHEQLSEQGSSADEAGKEQRAHVQLCGHLLPPPHEGAQVVQVQRPHADDDVDLLLAELRRVRLPACGMYRVASFESRQSQDDFQPAQVNSGRRSKPRARARLAPGRGGKCEAPCRKDDRGIS